METKAVFIDRDGTINVEKHYLHKIEEFELIPGALEALKLLNERGIKIYIVTNQAGIAKGHFSEDDYRKLTAYMRELFLENGIIVEDIFHCPHHVEGAVAEYSVECSCRKPKTGMVDDVIEKEGYKPDEMVVIGDKACDIGLGKNIGASTWLVETGYGSREKSTAKADNVVPDLLGAVKGILSAQNLKVGNQ